MKFFFSKFPGSNKAQGMSLNVVIIAIIVLIVLVILVWIFSGKMNIFGTGAASCTGKAGSCRTACLFDETSLQGTDCAKLNSAQPVCCIHVG